MILYKVRSLLITVMFIAVLTGPIALFNLNQTDYSATEKRMLATAPSLKLADGTANPNVKDEFINWEQDRIGLRSEFVNLVSFINYFAFKQSESDIVHVGKNGWLYFNDGSNLKIATGEYTLSQEYLEEILRYELDVEKKIAESGADYILMIPPSKVTIYPEYLRIGGVEKLESPGDVIADYLEANSDIKIIRLRDSLEEAKKERQIYFRTDTHWNQRGSYAAYCKMVEQMNKWDLCDSEPTPVVFSASTHVGDLAKAIGGEWFIGSEDAQEITFLNFSSSAYAETRHYQKLSEYEQQNNITLPFASFVNPNATDQRFLLAFGDSYFDLQWKLPELLAQTYGEFIFIYQSDIPEGLIEALEPDIVLYERVERMAYELTTYSREFLEGTPPGETDT